MWRKTVESIASLRKSLCKPIVVSRAHRSEATQSKLPVVSSNAPAFVSKGIQIKGEISGRENLIFDGVFEGKIQFTDGSFTAGLNAHLTADIEAPEIIVHGKVIGTLKAARIEVSTTGRVTGNMEANSVIVEDGAVLSSKVEVRRERPRIKEAAAGT
jgi:cytoskeletal protein CcmA (bactofilin family)